MTFTAQSSCGDGVFRWSFVVRTLNNIVIPSGTFCVGDSPRASCSGNVITTFANAFSYNSSLQLEAEWIASDKKRQATASTSITINFPEEETEATLYFGTNEEQLALQGESINPNWYSSVEYQFSCYSVDEGLCPPCPDGDFRDDGVEHYITNAPELILDFDDQFNQEICLFDLGFAAFYTLTNDDDIYVVSDQRQLSWNRDIPIPLIRFDPLASTCSTPTANGESYLTLAPVEPLPDNFMVVDVVWNQIEGPDLTCDDDLFNCGGDDNLFIFFPPQEEALEDCPTFRYEVTVFIGVEEDEPLYSSNATSCQLQFLNPPTGGECELLDGETDSDECNALPFSTATVVCRDWEIRCGQQNTLSTRLFRVSEGAASLVPLDNPSLDMSNEFFAGDEDFEVIVQICNLEVCTYSERISVEICELSDDERDDLIDDTLDNVEDQLNQDNLDDALQALLAIGDSLTDCDEFFDQVIDLTNQYITAVIESVDGNTTNLGDATVLMELLGAIGAKSCSAPVQLFESLLLLCSAPTAADVQSYALDELLQSIIDNAKSDDEKIAALDFAIDVNECVQAQALPSRCGDRLTTIYEGASFSFSQYIFTMEQFRQGKVRIDIPNATVIFPKGFDEQIARDYFLTTGDPVIRFSCVGINMARTNAILSTGVSIDSAIIGLTAMVYVNETAIIIDLGHRGEPVRDVILRIYRFDGDGSGRSMPSAKLSNGLRGEDIVEKDIVETKSHYEKRIFMNDCDESISCSYYEGEGFLSTAGCDTVAVTPEYVDCACDHYSNFGLLFQSCDSETWTIWRILSLALLAFFWFVLISLFSLTLFSPRFRRRTGLESRAEKRQRILGERTGVRNLEDD